MWHKNCLIQLLCKSPGLLEKMVVVIGFLRLAYRHWHPLHTEGYQKVEKIKHRYFRVQQNTNDELGNRARGR
jgi:hypothetical protein